MSTVPNSADTTTTDVVGYAIIPNWMTRDPSVTPMMVAVYVTVSGHCGQRGAWQISHQTLADEVGVSVPTIKRTLAALRDIGVLDWDTPTDPTRGCTYHLTYPVDHQRPTPQITHDLPPRSPMIYKEEPLEEPLEVPPTPADAGEARALFALPSLPETKPEDRFDEFWSHYPRKVAKPAARRAWIKATKRTRPEVILAALVDADDWFAAQIKPAGDFRPHPATWLNGERWLDERPKASGHEDEYRWWDQ